MIFQSGLIVMTNLSGEKCEDFSSGEKCDVPLSQRLQALPYIFYVS